MGKVKLLAITPNAEKVIEKAGRICYLSQDGITSGSHERFIKMLIGKKHESVLEHAYATFLVEGGSRSFTHQIVRHRLCAFSQQSQRYVNENNFNFIIPPEVRHSKDALVIYEDAISYLKNAYKRLVDLGIKREDARFLLPNAVESKIVISANFREWRHIFKLRCHQSAQWEIRNICFKMLKILKEKAPSVFYDFDV